MFNVILTEVGRNLNRCVRTCHSFGVSKLQLHNCDGVVKGNLFKGDQVELDKIDRLPDKLIGFEKNKGDDISKVDWNSVDAVLIGGEQSNITAHHVDAIYNIPCTNDLCLTTESALSIILHEVFNVRFQQVKNARYITPNLIASGLPAKKDILYLAKFHEVDCVIDLSDRERKAVKSGCREAGVDYHKIPIDEYNPVIKDFQKAINISEQYSKVLIHCYKGKHRTGVFLHLAGLVKLDPKKFTDHIKLMKLCTK